MKHAMTFAASVLFFSAAQAATPPDSGRHAIRVGDSENELVRQLGIPQRKIAVEDSTGNVVGKYLYYTVETGSVRFYIDNGRIQEISNIRGKE
jgi:hypothetical protein